MKFLMIKDKITVNFKSETEQTFVTQITTFGGQMCYGGHWVDIARSA